MSSRKNNLIFVVITFLILINLVEQTSKVHAESTTYIEELIAKAHSNKTSEKRAWNKLLFIPDHFLYTSKKSLISEKKFFLSSDGKNNPEHELIETLKAFNEPLEANADKDYMHP